jgi:transposase
MSLSPRFILDVPEETARVARAAFPNGNVYMTMRDELGVMYTDSEFASLFSRRGQPAESPGLLAMVTVMQYAEGLTDRQAAEAVRGRIEWKYALGLELTDPGFHYSVLSEFRDRLLAGGMEEQLLNSMLGRLQEKGLVKARGQQRSDSTHVLAAVRQLNRLKCVGETIRRVLNDLATVDPDWLQAQITPDWFDRYSSRFELYRLPKKETEQEALQEQIGADGSHLLSAIYAQDAPGWLRELPSVEIMRRVWIQQYYVAEGRVKWRPDEELPPNKLLIQSPYDPQARNSSKRELNWTGYVAHITETCDEDGPNIITNVETTPATTTDVEVTPLIHANLAEKELLPHEHFLDSGYISAEHIVDSRTDHDIELVGPVLPDPSWQAKAGQGFDSSGFVIDWEAQTVTCPRGHASSSWRFIQDDKGNDDGIRVRFARSDCLTCSSRPQCTRAKENPRFLRLRSQAQHEALQAGRERQKTPEFKERYKKRAGVEGTISQGARSFDLRRSRYVGLAKTHLQHVAMATAMNLTRVVAWLTGIPKAQTRQSRFAALAPPA